MNVYSLHSSGFPHPRRSPRAWPALVLVLFVSLAGCGSSSGSAHGSSKLAGKGQVSAIQGASIMLDWVVNSDHGGIYTAMQRGYFAQRHIAVQPRVPSSADVPVRLVAAGKVDFGITYETDLLAARAHHVPVRSVMCIIQHPLDTVMTLRTSGITRPRQLAGKTIGEAGSPSDNPIISAMMMHDGSSIAQARTVNVGYSLLPALLTGKVDAVVGVYWTWEAIQAQQKGHPVNVMRVERWGVPNYCELVLAASEQTIRTRPALVRGTVQALQQGYAYAEAHPAAAWQALHAQDNTLNQALVTGSLRMLRPAITDASTIGYQNAAQWRNYAGWLARHKLIDAPVNADQAFTNQFLQPGVR